MTSRSKVIGRIPTLNSPRWVLFLSVFFLLTNAFATPDSLTWDQFDTKLKVDAGQVVKGFYTRKVEFQPVNRNTVVLSQTAKYGDAWEFNAGFEAILWWPFGASDVGLPPESRTIRVQPGPPLIKARWNFVPQRDEAYVDLGSFPYKYNPDARNLGEYLYRSGTYPGMLRTTDGFHLLNYAAYDAIGAHFHVSLLNDFLAQDLNFFSEPNIFPTGDITPAYEVSLSGKIFQAGAGAAYNRLISFHPSQARPSQSTDDDNRYIEVDSGGQVIYKGIYASPQIPFNVKQLFQNGGDSTHTIHLHYYTQRGIKLMGRLALDFGFLLPEDIRGPKDLRVFGEAAVLGVEDQPYYYEDIWQRIPVMIGVNFPTFKMLDLLSFQTEYYASPFNNDRLFIANSYPVWDPDAPRYNRDNWKWSLYAEKKISKLFKLEAQIANDHLRLPELTTNLSTSDITVNPSHWYYMIRFEFGG